MTTLQKLTNAVIDEGGGQYPWEYIQEIKADDGSNRVARVTLYQPYGYTPSSWLRLGFDLSGVPASSIISGVAVDLLDAWHFTGFGPVSTHIEVQYWDGANWRPAGNQSLTGAAADYSVGSFVLSREVLTGWSNGYGVRVRAHQTSAGPTTTVYLGAVAATVTYSAPTAPTVTAIDTDKGSGAGGLTVTITGTGFRFGSGDTAQDTVTGVTIGGVACTDVTVVNETSLTCVTGAHAAGQVDVVVTNSSGSGTLSNGFTYLSVVDSVVKVVKGGTVSGDNKASADLWPDAPTQKSYGGAQDLWGASLTVADVNASNFGVVLSTTVGTGAVAKVDRVAVKFHYTLPGLSDPASYVAVLRVDSDRQTARPDLYKLPRSGFTVGNDPQINRAISDAEFRLSRIYQPSRNVEKVWHSLEFWLDASPETSTPGVQVWARVDEGTEFQLLDGAGNPATVRNTGPQEVFFPKGDQARGYYVQPIFKVPALSLGQVAGAYALRNISLNLSFRPKRSETYDVLLVLGQGAFEDRTEMRRSVAKQLSDLQELMRPGVPAVAMQDIHGNDVYGHVVGLAWREVVSKGENRKWTTVASVKLRMARYG